MALTETSAALDADIAASKTGLETALAAGHDVLDNLLARLTEHAGEVRAVASIADHPLVASAAQAIENGVPADILDGIAKSLSALASAFVKPEQPAESVPADEVPGAPADPAQEQAA
jgi:hypothetical protein